jgi:F420-dependent oxidoreductase-like protein
LIGPGPDDPLEAWTEMTAIAAVTSRVEVGSLVIASDFRSPALLAKMAATLDAISGGRLILGLGGGWDSSEHQAYGYDFPPVRTRLERLDEALEIIKRMWTQETPTFHGTHYRIENARCWPRPVRKPHPPILVGGAGEKVLLKLVARHADIWNSPGALQAQLPHKLEVLRAHCEEIGRPVAEIEISQQTVAAIGTDTAQARRRTEEVHRDFGVLSPGPELALVGTPDEIIHRVEQAVVLGATTFIMAFGREAGSESLRLFGKHVIPAFR